MQELRCTICFNDFDNGQLLPIVYTCGHTFCKECTLSIRKTTKKCPNCGVTIPQNHLSPNYCVLNLMELFNEQVEFRLKMTREAETIHSRIDSCKQILRDYSIKHQEFEKILEHCSNALNRLDFENVDGDGYEQLKFSLQTLKQTEENVKNIEYAMKNLMPKPELHFKVFKSAESYLYEIYKQIKKGKNVFSAHYVDNCAKIGKVTIWSDLLLFHNLHANDVGRDDLIVKFEDIKKCVTSMTFRAFIQISCNSKGLHRELVIKPRESSLMPQFMKLCTGELGPSYMGSNFVKGEASGVCGNSIMKLTYDVNDSKKPDQIDYCMADTKKMQFPCNTIVVIGSVNGGFQICQCTSNEYYLNVIGTVESPSDLKNLISYDQTSKRTVTDCGILFNLN